MITNACVVASEDTVDGLNMDNKNNKQLTPSQSLAVNTKQSLAVIASAGTGKTTVLVDRFLKSFEDWNVPLHQILAFTFTEKAASEMQERILKESSLDLFESQNIQMSTLHAFCNQVLKQYGHRMGLSSDFQILNDAAAKIWKKSKFQSWLGYQLSLFDSAVSKLYPDYGAFKLKESLQNLFLKEDGNRLTELSFQTQAEPYTQLWKDALKSLQTLKDQVFEEKLAFNRLEFADLELLTLKLLQEDEWVRHELQNRYHDILVDEYQDISPIQNQIIQLLFKPGHNRLFIVGDPKQSIYRFRQADVQSFFDMVHVIEKAGGQTIYLKETFRTPAKLQSSFNSLFNKLLGPDLYQESHSLNSNDSSALFVELPQDSSEKEDWNNSLQNKVIVHIQNLIQQNINVNDICILVRTHKIKQDYQKALEQASIAWQSDSEFELLDETLLTKSWMTLMSLKQPSPYYQLSSYFSDQSLDESLYNELSHTLPLQALYKSLLIEQSQALCAHVEPLSQIMAFVESWQSQGFNSLEDCQAFLMDLHYMHLKYKPTPQSKTGVHLLTVHASKGLQFKHVIVVPGSREQSEKSALQVQNDEVLFQIPEKEKPAHLKYDLKKTEDWDSATTSEKQDSLDEVKRLLYVALTRTKESVALFPFFPKKDLVKAAAKNNIQLDQMTSYNDLLFGIAFHLKDQVHHNLVPQTEYNETSTALTSLNDIIPKQNQSTQPLITVSELETYQLCPKRFELRYKQGVRPIKQYNLDFKPKGQASSTIPARVKGNVIHEVLQHYDFNGTKALNQIIGKSLKDQLVLADTDQLENDIAALLAKIQNQKNLQQLLVAPQDSQNEQPFLLDLDHFILKGQIDKLIKIRQDWMVLDFKTHKITAKGQTQQLFNEFEFQLLCYALAIKKNYVQSSVRVGLLFTHTLDLIEKTYTHNDLIEFENTLKSIFLKSSQENEFALTSDESICERCAYFDKNYCGIQDVSKL